jgi:glycyl-tRNA synthetase
MLFDSYREDVVDGEPRLYLDLAPHMAPIRCAILPLTKHQAPVAEKIYREAKSRFGFVQYDEGASIGKRYRRQDEIGTPLCVTIDYQTAEDNAVTVRERNTGSQERVAVEKLMDYLASKLGQ